MIMNKEKHTDITYCASKEKAAILHLKNAFGL